MGGLPATVGFVVLWPAMLPWLLAALLPLVLALWPLRHPVRVRWGATELVARAARQAGLNRRGVPVLLVVLRSLLLAAVALAAARPFLTQRGDTVGVPIVAGVTGRRIEIVVPRSATAAVAAVSESSLALRRGLEALAESPSALVRGGMPAVDVVAVGDAAAPFEGRRLIVLCDGVAPDDRDGARIAAAVEEGGSLLVCAGPDSMATPARPRLSAWLARLAGAAIEAAVPLHDAGIDAGDLAVEPTSTVLPGPTVATAVELVFDRQDWTVIARATDGGRPLLIERPVGKGRACVSAIPLALPNADMSGGVADEVWSDLAAWPVFVPFLDRLAARLIEPADSESAAAARARPMPRFTGLAAARSLIAIAALAALAEWMLVTGVARGAIDRATRAAALAVLTAMFVVWGGRPAEQPTAPDRTWPVAIVIDTSPSMATADAPHPREPATKVPRLDAVREAFTVHAATLRDLASRGGATLTTVDTSVSDRGPLTIDALRSLAPVSPAPQASRIGDAIEELLASDPPPAAIVVASDGAISSGASWSEVARRAAMSRVPLVAIPVGQTDSAVGDALPTGFRFTAVEAPAVCQHDERVAVALQAHGSTPHPQPIPLSGFGARGALEPVADDAPASLTYRFAGRVSARPAVAKADKGPPPRAVMKTLTVQAGASGPHACTVPLVVTTEPIRVLLVDAVPRYEHRFLAQMLARDERFDVASCMLTASEAAGFRRTQDLPQSVAEWNAFDVVVLGDVPIAAAAEPEAAAWAALRESVNAHRIGIAWLPGRRWARVDAGLASWLPAASRGVMPPRQRHVTITPGARRDGWLSFLDDATSARDPFAADVFTTLERIDIRPAARVLARAVPSPGAPDGPQPVPAIVVDRVGGATVLGHFCETWRWRQDGDTHARYWRHVLARLAEPHLLGRLVAATLAVRPVDPVAGEPVRIDITPTTSATALVDWTLDVSGDDEPVRRIAVPATAAGETVTVRLDDLAVGRHTLRLVPPESSIARAPGLPDAAIAHDVVVNEPVVEHPGGPAGTDPLAAAAEVTGGAVVTLGRVMALPDTIATVDRAVQAAMAPARPRWFASQAFAHVLVAALVAACALAWTRRTGTGTRDT